MSNPAAPVGTVPATPRSAAAGLNQDDFRKLLMTPRGGSSAAATPSAAPPATPRSKEKRSGGGGGGGGGGGQKQTKAEDGEEKSEKIRYRDRARERRQGKLGEYAETEQILAVLASNSANDMQPPSTAAPMDVDAKPAPADADEAFQKLSADQSKLLGGDMEHTHLVKGLDYSLLDKVRSDIVRNDPDAALKESKAQVQATVIQSDFARRVYAIATKQKKKEKNDLFAPGRLSYQYNLESADAFDVPLSIVRSKADMGDGNTKQIVSNNDIVVDKVIKIVAYIRQGSRSNDGAKRLKRKEPAGTAASSSAASLMIKPGAARAPMPVNLDDDIFPEAGKYQPELTMPETASSSAPVENWAKVTSGAWFGSSKDEADEGKPVALDGTESAILSAAMSGRIAMDGVVVDPKSVAAAAASSAASPASAASSSRAKPDLLTSIVQGGLVSGSSSAVGPVDAIAGLGTRSMEALRRRTDYEDADAADYSVTSYDSDDDTTDYSKMDQGTKKGQLSRFDFDDDEAYQRYKESQEATPKAAFQFGVKVADGRKKGKALAKDHKLDKDYQQITSMLRDKFNRPDLVPLEKGEARVPKTPRSTDEVRVPAKKQRMSTT